MWYGMEFSSRMFLGFIIYSVVLCNHFQIHPVLVFSHKDFHVNSVFFFVFVFHYCVIDHNKVKMTFLFKQILNLGLLKPMTR